MSKLMVCKSCSKEISKNAKACPACGEPIKRMGLLTKMFLAFFLFCTLPVLFVNSTPPKNTTLSAPTENKPPMQVKKDPLTAKREAKFGPRPEQSGWDGSYKEVKRYLAIAANDPDSIKIENCTQVSIDEKKGWLVGCDFRGNNAFGGKVLNSKWFVIKHGVVVDALPISTYK